METFSRGQQVVVVLIIFGMTLIYFHSITQPSIFPPLPQGEGRGEGGTLRKGEQPQIDKNLSGAQRLTLNKPINLNTATKNDLEAIPGIGQKTAERIVDYRKEHGRFGRIEDIMNIKGIKDKKFEKVKRYLTVK